MSVNLLSFRAKLIFVIFFILMNIAGASANMNELTIHYHRYDQNYDHWNLWTWLDHKTIEIKPSGQDSFGLIFNIDIDQYPPKGNIYFLPKYKNWENKGKERF